MSPRTRLATGWLTLFLIGTDLFVISPLLPAIAEEFDLSAAAAGLTATVFALVYMVAAPVLGAVADRYGRRRILTVSLSVFALANLLTALAPDFAVLVVCRAAAGAAASGVTPLVYAAVGDEAPVGRRATWMACAVSGLLLALSVGAPLGALAGVALGWRAPFAIIALAGSGLALANRMVWPAQTAASVGRADAGIAAALALRLVPTMLWATALYGVYTYLGLGLAAAGFSPAQTARTISLYGLAALAGTLLGGQVADRAGAQPTMRASLIGLGLCLVALTTMLHREWSLDLAVTLTSVTAQLFFPAQQAALTAAFPSRRATALAWNNSALFLGISLGGLLGGQAMTYAGFGATTALGAAVACLAAAWTILGRNAEIATKNLNDITSNVR